ncbi:DUF429 domain-containing protein [Xanthobacter autotrophicus]|uniref:DUF429 domain-containing protein n=1 Tax=Xanthobacter TaxID=279 RepID=UPI0024AC7C3B|nr:DUF429 domain-containing protein [Xanthobacter autotrophicus]MDI4666228.1 DUF429 domain-containing protein [Xanthobacter autotrophicus]
MTPSLPFAGIDGCRGGWIVARWDGGATLLLERIAAVAPLFERADAPDIAAIDMPIGLPIGLPEQVGAGGRTPERLVRPLLGMRQSSVFSVPARAAVMAGVGPGEETARYRAACAAALAASDPPRAVAKQCFHLFPKIAELDLLLRHRPELRARLVECHPEVAFWAMNAQAALDLPKKVKNRPHAPGLDLRRRLLGASGVPTGLLTEQNARALGAGLDDLIDAAACAVTAKRVAEGKALRFPDPPEADALGLPIAIVA